MGGTKTRPPKAASILDGAALRCASNVFERHVKANGRRHIPQPPMLRYRKVDMGVAGVEAGKVLDQIRNRDGGQLLIIVGNALALCFAIAPIPRKALFPVALNRIRPAGCTCVKGGVTAANSSGCSFPKSSSAGVVSVIRGPCFPYRKRTPSRGRVFGSPNALRQLCRLMRHAHARSIATHGIGWRAMPARPLHDTTETPVASGFQRPLSWTSRNFAPFEPRLP